jgi:hypothetical protein
MNTKIKGQYISQIYIWLRGKPLQHKLFQHNPSSPQKQLTSPSEYKHDEDYMEALFYKDDPIECVGIIEKFLMGVDFVHRKGCGEIDAYGHLINSIDGNRAYLLIVNQKTCHIWIMLARTKQPHIDFLNKFLEVTKLNNSNDFHKATINSRIFPLIYSS